MFCTRLKTNISAIFIDALKFDFTCIVTTGNIEILEKQHFAIGYIVYYGESMVEKTFYLNGNE